MRPRVSRRSRSEIQTYDALPDKYETEGPTPELSDPGALAIISGDDDRAHCAAPALSNPLPPRLVNARTRPYFLEVNALPGLLACSLYTRMLTAAHIGVEDRVDIFIDNSSRGPRYSVDVCFEVEV